MKILANIKKALSESISKPHNQNLTISETIALKNLLQISKERIWLSDPLNVTEYDNDDFDDYLTEDTIKKIKTSITLMDSYLSKHSTKN